MAGTLPQSKIQQIFKQYQRNPNRAFIGEHLGICPETVSKYIKSENMEDRRLRIIEMASDRMITKQADQLVFDMMEVQGIKDLTVDSLINRIESGDYAPTVSDLDKLERLGLHLRGLPSMIVEHRDSSIEVMKVRRNDIIDVECETED